MSAQPATVPVPPSRWTPYAVIGLLALVAGWIVRLIYEVDPEAVVLMSPADLASAIAESRTGIRLGDGLLLLGGSLLGWSPALPGLTGGGGRPGAGGSIGTGLGVGLVLASAAVATGCAPRHVVAETSVEVVIKRGPPCRISVHADGELVGRVDWSKWCEVALPESAP